MGLPGTTEQLAAVSKTNNVLTPLGSRHSPKHKEEVVAPK